MRSGSVEVVIPGKPFRKERPRIVRLKTGRMMAYTPKATREAENVLRAYMLQAVENCNTRWPTAKPVGVRVYAIWPCRKTRMRKTLPVRRLWKTSLPDIDNVIKAILDAGNRILWEDDRQVVRMEVEKIEAAQDEEAMTVVVAYPLPEEPPHDRRAP